MGSQLSLRVSLFRRKTVYSRLCTRHVYLTCIFDLAVPILLFFLLENNIYKEPAILAIIGKYSHMD